MYKLILSVLSLFIGFSLTAQIDIFVSEQSGHDYNNVPVTLGVPVEQGKIYTINNLSLEDSQGAEIPGQFSTMATWKDGSIKWIKTHLQVDLDTNKTEKVTLHLNGNSPVTVGNITTQTTDHIDVDVGTALFRVHRNAFNLLEQVWLDLDQDGAFENTEKLILDTPAPSLESMDENLINYQAKNGAPDELIIEEDGPLLTVIKAEGKHYDTSSNIYLKYVTRLYFHFGHSMVKIRHSYANGTSAANMTVASSPSLREMPNQYRWSIPFKKMTNPSISFGGDAGTVHNYTLQSGDHYGFLQKDRPTTNVPFEYEISKNGNTVTTGAKAEGWIGITNQEFGVMISPKYYWQKYAKEQRISSQGEFEYFFIPENSGDTLFPGMGSSDELTLYFYPKAEQHLIRKRAELLSKYPPIASVESKQYVNSNVFYDLYTCTPSYTNYTDYIDQLRPNHIASRDALDLYGNLNFGDVTSYKTNSGTDPDAWIWGNNYYDAISINLRLFATDLNPDYMTIASDMAVHWMETDTWNTYDQNNWLNGYCPAYSANHRSSTHFQHHYGEGIWYYYYLTGDERAREVGLRAAVSIKDVQTTTTSKLRSAYQRGSACLEAYKYTWDTTFLDFTKLMVDDWIIGFQNQYGLVGGYDNGTLTGGQTFMMGLYSDILWKYIQESQDTSLIDNLEALADFVDLYARVTPGAEEYYNWWYPPNHPGIPMRDTSKSDSTTYWNALGLIAGLYAYAYDLGGDPHYKSLAENTLNGMFVTRYNYSSGEQIFGKISAQAMKNVIHAIAIVDCRTELSVRLQLEGAYDANTSLMSDDLRDKGLLPSNDPWMLSHAIPPSALAMTGNDALVDWVLIEFRDPTDIAKTLYTASGLVQRDGDLVSADGVSPISFQYVLPQETYLLIHHKNHLKAMSSNEVGVLANNITYDFTAQNAYQAGGAGQKELRPGVWGLFTGNGNGDNEITGADKVSWAVENGMFNVYSSNDFNMDGEVNGADKIPWYSNNGLFSAVP